MRASAEIQNEFYIFRYLRTNDTIAKFTLNDLDLLYQSQKYKILISRKQRELAQTNEMTLST